MKLTVSVIMATALLASAGCKKKADPEPPPPAATPAPPPPPPPAPAPTASAPGPGEVQRYADEVQIGHATVELLQQFHVHQAADLNSPTLTTVGRGTLINVMATHSNWMLIEYPSGVGVMSPGWIDLRNIYDRRVRQVKVPARLPGGRRPPGRR